MMAEPDRTQASRRYVLIVVPSAILAIGVALLSSSPSEADFKVGELERARAGVPSATAAAGQPASFAGVADKTAS
jgi:hypothetical protein